MSTKFNEEDNRHSMIRRPHCERSGVLLSNNFLFKSVVGYSHDDFVHPHTSKCMLGEKEKPMPIYLFALDTPIRG